MTKKEQAKIILILGALSTISPFAIDMYLPGFPVIAKDLNTTIAHVQLSLTSYFIGIAAGQLLYGPLLDRFGRKKPLFIGLAVYVLASIGCAFTSTADALIAMRFIQALGGCVGMVAAQTFVRDLFPIERSAQAFSWMTLVVAVSPMIAPTVGGYLMSFAGWQSVFIALAVVTVLILWLAYKVLPDGRPANKELSLRPQAVLSSFYEVAKHPRFVMYCLGGGLIAAAPFAYIAGSADVFMNLHHLSEKEYGWVFALIGGVIIGSTQMNHLLLRHFSSEQIIRVTIIYQIVVGAVLISGALMSWFNVTALIALIALFLAAHGITNTNATALSLAPFSRNTGSAASLLGSFRMAMGGVTSALVSAFHNGTAIPMILVMVGTVVAGFLIMQAGKTLMNQRHADEGTIPALR